MRLCEAALRCEARAVDSSYEDRHRHRRLAGHRPRDLPGARLRGEPRRNHLSEGPPARRGRGRGDPPRRRRGPRGSCRRPGYGCGPGHGGEGRQRLRGSRHPRQQRRDHQGRALPVPEGGRLGRRPGDRPEGGDPNDEDGRARDAAQEVGEDHQHRFCQWHLGARRPDQLLRGERRPDRLHEGARARDGDPWHHGQRRRSRSRGH